VLGDKPQRPQLGDELAVHAGLGVEVEVAQPPRGGQAGKPGQRRLPSGLGGGDLDRQEPLEEGGVAGGLGGGALQLGGQRLGGGLKAQRGQVAAEPLVGRGLGGLAGGAHRAPASSSAPAPSTSSA